MTIIRVATDELRSSSDTIQGVGANTLGCGRSLLNAAQGLPSYDGQFAPVVASICAGAFARSQGLHGSLRGMGERMNGIAGAFEEADNVSVARFQNTSGELINLEGDSNQLIAFIDWLKNELGIENYLQLGNLALIASLIGITFPFSLISPFGLLLRKNTFWGLQLPWHTPSPNIQPSPEQVETSPTTPVKSKFGELLEKAEKERQAQEQQRLAELEGEKQAKKKDLPKIISDYPARSDDGTFMSGQEKGDSCSIASTRMALQRATGTQVKESDLRTASSNMDGGYQNNANKWGTNPSSLDDLINTHHSDIAEATYSNPNTQSVDDLERAASDGKGIVVSVRNSEWFGSSRAHSVTVVGVETKNDQQMVIVNDPWPPGEGKKLSVPASEFDRAWYGDATYITAKPKVE
jgi:hypothetical protein